ncbi:hypothetical protein LR48_Vigan08g113900 [Vigna angularis]|uniref:Uncharacterized protein n=1 Tax=Phaseolus angularis TaxID=3914 RepID=A0A0L9V5T5_PHAAN|nr:hypothetical protein LR48_Vigan08g113900 [Vigna angularis]
MRPTFFFLYISIIVATACRTSPAAARRASPAAARRASPAAARRASVAALPLPLSRSPPLLPSLAAPPPPLIHSFLAAPPLPLLSCHHHPPPFAYPSFWPPSFRPTSLKALGFSEFDSPRLHSLSFPQHGHCFHRNFPTALVASYQSGASSGSDAIVLGADTLRGLYPVKTISTVGKICAEVGTKIASSSSSSPSAHIHTDDHCNDKDGRTKPDKTGNTGYDVRAPG